MEAIRKTGKPVVLCLAAGSDIDLSFASENFNAVLDVWYPGAMGGKALARVLFGEASPGGKLPVTFYNSLEDLPDFTDYAMKGRTYRYMEKEAQYPFGYGLTYGDVHVRKADFAYEQTEEDGFSAVMAVKAENVSDVPATDVIQIYIQNLDSPLAIKNPALCGFARVSLAPGEQKKIAILIPKEAFLVVNEEGKRIVDGKRFALFAGTSQPDAKSIALTGKKPLKMEVTLAL